MACRELHINKKQEQEVQMIVQYKSELPSNF